MKSPLLLTLSIASLLGAVARGQEEVAIKLGVLPGLKFDVPRFAVKPGAKVTIAFHNPDQMIHNFVLTAPGARMDVVNAALALGAEGTAKNFVPDSSKVLAASKALAPGETTTFSFTAPTEENVYPYVCTYPGHGFIMYGAMYVTTKPLPPLESDPNVSPSGPTAAEEHVHHHLDRPTVNRTFLPDCGPAAMAIGFPNGQSYCFDAGACRIRYVWKGGFVDNTAHWAGKGDTMGKVVGRIYYRAGNAHPIRIDDPAKEPTVQWRGYEMVDGNPRLHYRVDGVDVWEQPTAKEDGFDFAYQIKASTPVFIKLDQDGGAEFKASAGTLADGVLKLTPEEAKQFTLTLKERPGVEPVAYWSMNDTVFTNTKEPLPGVVGRAFTPGGTSGKPKVLDSGVSTAILKSEATLMAWVRVDPPQSAPPGKTVPKPTRAVFTAGEGADAFEVLAPTDDTEWHHLALTFKNGNVVRFVDGQSTGTADIKLPAEDANIVIGSLGTKSFLQGLIDEVRLYDRVVSDAEIAKIYQREKPSSTTTSSSASRP